MKPHEETWELSPCGGSVVTADGSLVSYRSRGQRRKDVARLAAAAPEMARAILLSGSFRDVAGPLRGWHMDECWDSVHSDGVSCTVACDASRAALVKAGVLP